MAQPHLVLLDFLNATLLPIMIPTIDGTEVQSNGTGFIVKPETKNLLVTAAHVYTKAALRESETVSGKTWIGQCSISLKSRLLEENRALDLAIFDLSESEVESLGSTPVPLGKHGWPPPMPCEDDLAVVSGYPGEARYSIDHEQTDLGRYTAALKVSSVTARQVRLRIPDPSDPNIEDFTGGGIPPQNYPLGGISGGPVFVLEPAPVLTWRICAVVTDQQECFGDPAITASRIDYIDESGGISFMGD